RDLHRLTAAVDTDDTLGAVALTRCLPGRFATPAPPRAPAVTRRPRPRRCAHDPDPAPPAARDDCVPPLGQRAAPAPRVDRSRAQTSPRAMWAMRYAPLSASNFQSTPRKPWR